MKHFEFLIAIILIFLVIIACGKKSDKEDTPTTKKLEQPAESITEEKIITYGSPHFLDDSIHVLIPVKVISSKSENYFDKLFQEFSELSSKNISGKNIFNSSDIYNIIIYNRDSLTSKVLLKDRRRIKFLYTIEPSAINSRKLILSLEETTEDKDKEAGETVFLTALDSISLKPVTPQGIKFLGWQAFPERDELFIQYQEDSDGNGKFETTDKIKITKTLLSDPVPGFDIISRSAENELNLIYTR